MDEGSYSVGVVTPILRSLVPPLQRERVVVSELGYGLWTFQKRMLSETGDYTLILGLPTGLGKTYLAGVKLLEESRKKPIAVFGS